ncbi:MAG TPA: LytR family transcriptional regulator, partial [Roseiflexaceae bacterium]|nr:LytR family transcriptional regulator [Roseiflexaceae bacterium]
RNQRQQQVLMAIFERVREQGLLSQLTNIDEYTDAMSDYIRTDLSKGDMLSLANMGSKMNAESIQRYAIDPSMVVERRAPAYVLVLSDKKGLKRLVNQMLDPAVASAGGETPSR